MMMQFKPYNIIFLDKSKEEPSPEEFANAMNQTETLKFNRGHFLDYVIQVEIIIDVIIENYILHNNSRLKRIFRKNIINNKNITFMQKIGLLYDIIKEVQELTETDLESLKKCLDFIRVERNKWAHGNIYFKQEKGGEEFRLQPYLNSINSQGNETETKLTNAYLEELMQKFQINQKFLVKILVKRGFLSKDYLFKK